MSIYEMALLSELLAKSGKTPHPDFTLAVHCIFSRLDSLSAASPNSQFNRLVRWLKRLVPRILLIKLFQAMSYDTMICFKDDEDRREVCGMISFQKHPKKAMLGMFDIYIVPHLRDKDLLGNFDLLADMVYQLSQKFKDKFTYMQCGKNATTQRVLRLYQRTAEKKQWQVCINIEDSRIYLQ
jgi:hypothetical protein